MRFFVQFLGFLFAAGAIMFVVGAVGATWAVLHYSKDLPDFSQLQLRAAGHDPRARGGRFAGCRICARAPSLSSNSGDPEARIRCLHFRRRQNFWEHGGIDLFGIARAVVNNIEQWGTGRRPQGASTITQQVAKNFLVGNETSINRKIKEALLALRIKHALFEGKNSRTLSERHLSRSRRLRHRRRVAPLFRQVGSSTRH